MVKKCILLFAVMAAAVVGFVCCRVCFAQDVSASENNSIDTSAAVEAAGRMERLCCGVVSGSDISMEQSAFATDFVPREPEYVERFRHYDGPKADFVPVLMYHFFYDANTQEPTKGNNSHAIQSVRVQLQWFWENGYVTLTMDELYEWLNGNIEIPAKCVLLTSDDGQDNFFELLQPELHRYGFKATSFVITAWRHNLPYKLTLPNVELHSHTDNMHRGNVPEGGVPTNRGMMQGVAVEYGVEDLKKSSEKLGGSKYFAYPFGNFGGNSKEILAQAGFRMAFTTQYGPVRRGYDLYELPRMRVSGSLGINGLKVLLNYKTVIKKYEAE